MKLGKFIFANQRSARRDPRVDAYIAKQADFAKPILCYLREYT